MSIGDTPTTYPRSRKEILREVMAPRVERGVALLDREMPGWWRADRKPYDIDTELLNMGDGGWCALGQLEAPGMECAYGRMAKRLFGPDWVDRDIHYGVHASSDSHFPVLTELWRAVIEKRRANV